MIFSMPKFRLPRVFSIYAVSIIVLCATTTHLSANVLSANQYQGLLLNPTKQVKNYPLINHDGKTVDFPSANGNYQLIFFGYTSCLDICPTLGDETRVNYNFVSIDVERDTPNQLKEFVTYFDPKIKGFTGNIHNIKAVEKEFGILTRKFQGTSALAYKLEHSVFMYLIDPKGKLVLMYPGSTLPKQIVSDLHILLSLDKKANSQEN